MRVQTSKNRILILGALPPPVGGVTIHVQRLLQFLSNVEYPYNFADIRRLPYSKLFFLFLKSKWIHLHTSNVYFRFTIAFLGKLCGKNVILTVHGNLGRFNGIKNFFDNLSLKLATIPLVINNDSLQKGKKLNDNMVLISAFIPPIQRETLNHGLINKIISLKNQYEIIFCTNAYNMSYDKNGNEIYQIIMLIKIFREIKQKALIISDPSGAYQDYVMKTKEKITQNITFISCIHSFFEVLKLSDVLLRVTSTDGDSLSVKEAIYLGKNVIATNVVDRPKGIVVVDNNFYAIKTAIQDFMPYENSRNAPDNGAELILDLYKRNVC